MHPRFCFAFLVFTVPTFTALPGLAKDNIEMDINEIPKIVLQKARLYAPDLQFTRYAYEDEGAFRIYEFSGHDKEGRQIEIDIMADGNLQEIEMEIPWAEVPIHVQIEFTRQAPDMTPALIERSILPNGSTVYEIEQMVDDQLVQVEILDDGRKVEMLSKSQYPTYLPDLE